MPRWFYCVVIASVALLAMPLAAQNSATVQQVTVRGAGDSLEVEIQTSGKAVSPDTQAITGPDRIVVDFPGALPSAALHALKVNRGVLKGVRSGLFFNNPPITRIVLDLTGPQSYHISTNQNAVVVKLGPTGGPRSPETIATTAGARLHDASLASVPQGAHVSNASMPSRNATRPTARPVASESGKANMGSTPASPQSEADDDSPAEAAAAQSKPVVDVTYANGLLRIHAERATLAQVLFEVQQQTKAEIAIPAGAEQEQVVADLGPAPAREVLGSLLNGSPYNFIFVGDEMSLDRVILTRAPNAF